MFTTTTNDNFSVQAAATISSVTQANSRNGKSAMAAATLMTAEPSLAGFMMTEPSVVPPAFNQTVSTQLGRGAQMLNCEMEADMSMTADKFSQAYDMEYV